MSACKVGTPRNAGKYKICTFLYGIFSRTPSGARIKMSARKRGGSSSIRSGMKRVTSTLRHGGRSRSRGGSCSGGSFTSLLGGKKSGGAVRPGVASAAVGAPQEEQEEMAEEGRRNHCCQTGR